MAHGAIHIDDQEAQAQLVDLLVKQLDVEGDQRLQRLLRKLFQSIRHGVL